MAGILDLESLLISVVRKNLKSGEFASFYLKKLSYHGINHQNMEDKVRVAL